MNGTVLYLPAESVAPVQGDGGAGSKEVGAVPAGFERAPSSVSEIPLIVSKRLSQLDSPDYTAEVRVRYAALRPPLTPARRPEGPTGTRGRGGDTISTGLEGSCSAAEGGGW